MQTTVICSLFLHFRFSDSQQQFYSIKKVSRRFYGIITTLDIIIKFNVKRFEKKPTGGKLERALNKSKNNKKFKNECSKLSVVKDSLLKECNSLRASVEKLKSLKTQSVEMCNEMKTDLKNKELECLELQNENSDMLVVLNNSKETMGEAKNTLDDNVSENNDLKEDNDYLTALLHDDDQMVIETWDEEKQTFKPELTKCIMKLLDLSISARHVSDVVKEVCKMCGKVPKRLPSRQTVDRMNDQRLSLALKQTESL
ncbi:unnamed protein product [Mytilus coruscus]|uniref:Uncharacterized protein n=1 Tax=Mytilus coruscus TaxID=42192 RepID=A0A6J8AQ82_MYTCO|nr:unnamed protein product [Mytilus coruscus]